MNILSRLIPLYAVGTFPDILRYLVNKTNMP